MCACASLVLAKSSIASEVGRMNKFIRYTKIDAIEAMGKGIKIVESIEFCPVGI